MCQWFQALESILYWVEQKKFWAAAFPWNIHATKEEPSLKSSSFTISVRKNQSQFESVVFLKWTQYKKLGQNALRVHILKFEILQITWKKWNKEHQTISYHFFTNTFSILMFFVSFFQVVCKISNFDISEPKSIWRKLLVLSWL